ncbi:uncharacterized protein LOC119073618 isoform X3 [Bradysia coprophila]|uniref:uncharacterized protein LOC119073618 isoform X3 n=1 Tax=Bradysia coprophila TaxID=38358 RepID=UPI00187DACC3|nr:uncharacterized protein LOC119073618 isoform X3 [Bradysia coprophila]
MTTETKDECPNNWTSTNVWVDTHNRLHLKVAYSPSSGWSCAKLQTNVNFGFGTYRWFIQGAIDKFDPNIVLGLFTYGGVDYINEIDIEIAKWGRNQSSNLFYTVYPSDLNGSKSVSSEIQMILQGTYTTHQFNWTKDYVRFQSQHGFKSSPTENVFFSYQTPANFTHSMPVIRVPLHMNLWMFKGRPPTDGKEVEIVVNDFQYEEELSVD